MSAIMYLLTQKQGNQGMVARFSARLAGLSEAFWFCASLLLFLLLGPFSAVIVVIALFSLAGQSSCKEMAGPKPHSSE
ncbi:MAG: hypothetical protein ABFR97_04795 [Thermodesulfobacteriota bacterium]